MPMDPLIEVSTDGGTNMRETCARVLAAALMTGAIATVVAMSALSGATGEAGRPFAAPPSSLKRSVPMVRQAIEPQPGSIRPAAASISARPHQVAVTRRPVVARHWSPPRQLAAATPKTKSKPAPAAAPPAPAPTPTAAAEPAPPTVEAAQLVETPQPAASADDQGQQQGKSDDAHSEQGRGHAYGHDKHDE